MKALGATGSFAVLMACAFLGSAWFQGRHARGLPQRSTTDQDRVVTVPFCVLVSNSENFVGKTVTTTAHVTAYKHGTGLSDNACPELSADLWQSDSQKTSPEMMQFQQALWNVGMSDHPLVATLTGTWLGKQYKEHQFLHQPRTVFQMTDVTNFHQSHDVERPSEP